MSGSSALSTFVATVAVFVYEAIDPVTKLAFYVGRTGNLDRRARQHQRRCMKKIRELMKLKDFKFKDVQRRVPELPHGCAADDAQEMEAYFIFERKVVYDPETCPHGCNSRIGDHGTELTPTRFAELKQLFATAGYEFPVEEPQALRDARAEYAIAGEFVAMANAVNDDESVKVFTECTALAKRALLNAERVHLGLRAFVERVLADYDKKYVDAVDQQTLQTAFNMIKDKMEEDKAFEDLTRVVTSMSLVCKPKKGVDVSSEAAASFLVGILAMIGSREEATLEWTNRTVEKNIKAVRTWTRAHGMKKPVDVNRGKYEQTLANFLKTWKSDNDNYGGKCTDLQNCRVVMRGVDWFQGFISCADKNANDWIELNKQLCDGFGWWEEPKFEGKRLMKSSNGNNLIYKKLNSLVAGRGKRLDVAVALKGLPPERAAYYQRCYDTKRAGTLQKDKAKNIRRKRKREAAAAKPAEEDEGDEEENRE
jgi:hypothetical protein